MIVSNKYQGEGIEPFIAFLLNVFKYDETLSRDDSGILMVKTVPYFETFKCSVSLPLTYKHTETVF